MVGVEHHCLLRNKQSDKQIRFAAREGIFGLPDAEIVIIWKGKTVRMRTNQIGDGMIVPLVYERSLLETLDWNWVTKGLSIYQEYDEETDTWKTFLWKYPGGEGGIDAINAVRQHVDLGIVVEKVGKFVQVLGAKTLMGDGEGMTVYEAIGFLVGLCLGYGAPKNKTDQKITTWQVNIPCLGEIMRHETIINNALHICRDHGIFVIHSDVKQRDLTVWNWTIHDTELVAFLRAIWTDTRPMTIEHLASESLLVEYLEQNGVKGDYVLKFVGK